MSNPWNLFLDDERHPFPHCTTANLVICRTAEEAIKEIEKRGCLPNTMYLDGYLGVGMHGMQFLMWLKKNHKEEARKSKYNFHSSDFETKNNMATFVLDVWGRDAIRP